MGPINVSLARELRARILDGRPSEAVLDGWRTLESSLSTEPEAVAEALGEAARLDASEGFAALTSASAVGAAVVSVGGELVQADDTFLAWFGPPQESLGFRRLFKAALKSGRAVGLVEAVDGSSVAACAGSAEIAGGWPLSPTVRAALDAPGRRVALLGFAPSRASDLAARACMAYGFTPLEARLAEALIDAPNLHEAAARIGVGRETAREALKKAMRKAAARRSPDLVRRMMDLMIGSQPPSADVEEVLRSMFACTPAEARAAARFAEGLTAKEAAEALGVKEATARGQLKAVFAKTGVAKAKDLVRLAVETSALATLTSVAETVLEAPEAGHLRIATAVGDRRVALLDYGPRGGRPVVVFHGLSTGRTLPPRLTQMLQAGGWRPIVPQRPGFGLTDPAPDGEYLATAADDLAAVLDLLKVRKTDILARDGSAASALAFAARHPGRVGKGLLFNPRLPGPAPRLSWTIMGAVARAFYSHPEMIGLFAEMMRRQTRTDLLKATLRQSLKDIECDRRTLEQPGVLDQLVGDVQALMARSSAGFAAEQSVYAHGWAAPRGVGGSSWSVVELEVLGRPGGIEVWGDLPGLRCSLIPDAGMLAHFSHPEVILAQLESA